MYFDIYKSTKASNASAPYWWVIKSSGNHATLCHSEMLSSKQACKNAIRIVKDGAAGAIVYDETGEVAANTQIKV